MGIVWRVSYVFTFSAPTQTVCIEDRQNHVSLATFSTAVYGMPRANNLHCKKCKINVTCPGKSGLFCHICRSTKFEFLMFCRGLGSTAHPGQGNQVQASPCTQRQTPVKETRAINHIHMYDNAYNKQQVMRRSIKKLFTTTAKKQCQNTNLASRPGEQYPTNASLRSPKRPEQPTPQPRPKATCPYQRVVGIDRHQAGTP